MKLAFLMERQYAPYSKWMGTAFGRLKIGRKLAPVLQGVLAARTWKAREKKLAEAYSIVARQHNALRIIKPLPTKATKYYGRPFLVGVSRKKFLGRTIGGGTEGELIGTVAAALAAAAAGASLFRVHDVAAHVAALKVFDAIRNS